MAKPKSPVPGVWALPIGLEGSVTRGLSMSEVPKTFPEVVSDFRHLVDSAVDAGHTLIVGIDELDKMESSDKAALFLNDIKAIFGGKSAFYIVSVSEDAMARFEQRGLPYRDAFHSAFDEIVKIEHMKFANARTLMDRRIIGLPVPFLGLAYVLAGGLPRDLIRLTRRMLERREPGEIAVLACELASTDLRNRVGEAVASLRRQDGGAAPAIAWSVEMPVRGATAGQLLRHCKRAGDLLSRHMTGETLRIVVGLAAHEYFCASVIAFFSEDWHEPDWIRAAGSGSDGSSFDQLAGARQLLGQQPETAWLAISEFRSAWDMKPCPPPGFVSE